ncbi:transglutaminase domain-containing protein [Alteromonas sp. H39]|uniref:DUF3857 domain-containing protein n=1 Tax=Alteromonas sp. H39 TaxID=3389876 RepID=UPI0039E0F4B5
MMLPAHAQMPPVAEHAIHSLSEADKQLDVLTALEKRIDITLQQDKAITTVTTIWFYPTKSSVQDSGYESVYYRPDIETLDILFAGSISPRGEVREVDAQSVKDVESDTYNTFTDTRQKIISYPGLQAGGASVIQYQIVHPLSADDDWSSLFRPQLHANTLKYELQASWTDERPLVVASNSNEVTCEQAGNTFRCAGENILPAAPDEEVSWSDELGQIALSTLDDWRAVQDIVLSGFNDAMENSAEVASLAQTLTKDAITTEEKIAAIYEFVARDVRYVSMSEAGHAIVPHHVDSTIANRYGDCKDKSVLLLALLREIGIEANPVLVATERREPENVLLPSVSTFDHVVVCFENDAMRCLDPTDAYTPWTDISDWIQNRVALPLNGEPQLSVIPADQYRWKLEASSEIAFTSDGGQTEVQTVTYLNAYEGQIRSKLAGLGEGERQKWASELYESIVSEGANPEFSFHGINELTADMRSQSKTTFSPYFSATDGFLLEESDAWIQHELATSKIENTRYDVHFPGAHITSTYAMTFPASWRISRKPVELDFEHVFGTMHRDVSHQQPRDGQEVLKVITRLQIPARKLTAKEFDQFNAFISALSDYSLITFAGSATK